MTPQELDATFRRAYEEHADAIFRHCFFRVFDRERAKELTQDAFLRTWDYLANRGNIDNIRAFLYKTATNLVIDHARKQSHRPSTSLEVLQESGFEPVKEHVAGADVQSDAALAIDAIDQLKGPYRDVLYLRFVHGFGPKEIAERLNLSENVVSVRINRALKRVRTTFL